ncbi:hypothetical protein GCK32_006368, partial [Trichostrongylus colubriformis]
PVRTVGTLTRVGTLTQPRVVVQQAQPQQLYVAQQPAQPYLRKGYYYQHYPYYNLPRQYRLRPQYGYAYPPQYQNAQYTYHHWLPYRDYYNIYRSDPRFNPAIPTPVTGCAGGGCGGGESSV